MNKALLSFEVLVLFILNGYVILVDGQCNDFNEIKKDSCQSLNPEDNNKKCSLINEFCKVSYSKCEHYVSDYIQQNICTSIIPNDPIYKCIVENNKCVSKIRGPDELLEGTEKNVCEKLEAGENRRYLFINNKCEQHYKKCEDYKDNVIGSICESNIPIKERFGAEYDDYLTKCVYNKGKCQSEPRTCSDLKSYEEASMCYSLKPKDDSKKCVYSNGKCFENYAKCEDYTGNVDEKICESIIPFIDGNIYPDFTHKCIKEGNECISAERYCEDYKSGEEECSSLPSKDENKRCALVDNKCIEQYKQCEDYKEKDSQICESIEPLEEYDYIDYSFKCILEEENCVKKEKSCSDYKYGQDKDYCTEINLGNDKKKCFYYNKECIEEYKSCEDYTEDVTKEACESIKLFNYKNEFDVTKKCVYNETKKICETQKKSCSTFQSDDVNSEICNQLSTEDSSKSCIFYINKCIETYANCKDYKETVKKDICESIIPKNYIRTKCVYSNGKCVDQEKKCDEYNINLLKNKCENISPGFTKKCIYSNYFCYEKKKSCLDYKDEEVNQEICESSPSSASNKKCSYNKEKKRCEEFDYNIGIMSRHKLLFIIIVILCIF